MSETRANVNCINHPPMSASMRCDTCATVYCRLCFRIENNMFVCKTCGTLGKPATDGQILSEKDRRSTQFLKRVSGVGPAAGEAVAPKKSLRELQAAGSRKPTSSVSKIPTTAASASKVPPSPPPHTETPPQADAESPDKENRGNEPQFLKKTGPFFCKNHPDVKATRRCGQCVEYYCEECIKIAGDNPICPACSFPLKRLLAADQGFAPKPLQEQIASAFVYPFKGRGLLVLLFCSPFIWLLGFAGIKGTIIGLGFAYAYFMKIVQASASGRETPPEFPSLSNFVTDIFGPLLHFFCAWMVSMLPAFLYLFLLAPVSPWQALIHLSGENEEEMYVESNEEMLEDSPELALLHDPQADLSKHADEVEKRKAARAQARRETNGPSMSAWFITFTVLGFLGTVYYPMAIMALALYRSLSVLNPLFVFQSIGKLGAAYIVPFLIYFASEIIRVIANSLAGGILFIGTLITTFVWMYIMMVEMNVLGVLYFSEQRKLDWFGGTGG